MRLAHCGVFAVILLALQLGLAAPARASGHSDTDVYVDVAGRQIDFSRTYDGWFAAKRYAPNFARAAAENGVMLVLELSIYWFDPSANIVDWQYPNVASKLSSSESFRFDDNLLRTNYVFHSSAGASHYLLTRISGFGVLGSFGAAAGSSAIYEMLLEWKELVSINDLIVTPFGGMAMGEFFYHLGNYLNSEPPRVRTSVRAPFSDVVRNTARYTFGAPRAIHDRLDDPPPAPVLERDNLGLSSAYAHRFRLLFGEDTSDAGMSRVATTFSVDGHFELGAMPGFMRPGRFQRWFAEGNFTSFDARVAIGKQAHDVELCFDAALLGSYSQAFLSSAHGLRGIANETALGTGLCYVDRHIAGMRDQYGIVHLLRPIERVWFGLGRVQLGLGLDASPDFASVRSAAFEVYRERFGSEGAKSSLLSHGYVHAWGLSVGALAAVSSLGFELGIAGRYGRYASIDGLERFQEDVTREAHGLERIRQVTAHLGFEPERTPLSTRLEVTDVKRTSRLGSSIETSRTLRRLTVGLGIRF